MLLAVVLDRDFNLLPTHIEITDPLAKLVDDGNLRLWPRQAGSYEQ